MNLPLDLQLPFTARKCPLWDGSSMWGIADEDQYYDHPGGGFIANRALYPSTEAANLSDIEAALPSPGYSPVTGNLPGVPLIIPVVGAGDFQIGLAKTKLARWMRVKQWAIDCTITAGPAEIDISGTIDNDLLADGGTDSQLEARVWSNRGIFELGAQNITATGAGGTGDPLGFFGFSPFAYAGRRGVFGDFGLQDFVIGNDRCRQLSTGGAKPWYPSHSCFISYSYAISSSGTGSSSLEVFLSTQYFGETLTMVGGNVDPDTGQFDGSGNVDLSHTLAGTIDGEPFNLYGYAAVIEHTDTAGPPANRSWTITPASLTLIITPAAFLTFGGKFDETSGDYAP